MAKYLKLEGLQEVKDQMDLIYAQIAHKHNYNDLENKPAIETDDQEDKLTIEDQNGNAIAEIDNKGVNSVDFLIKGKPITKIFVGTQAEYEAAYAKGEIPVGSVVILQEGEYDDSGEGGTGGDDSDGNNGVIPTVETLDDPTSDSPSFVMYEGELYVLVDDEEEV